MRLNVYLDGNFVVTRPRWVGEFVVEKFILQNADWVLKKLRSVKSIDQDVAPDRPQQFAEHKDRALEFVRSRVTYWNQFYHFDVANIGVRNQKTRWGSCSSKRTLSFNFKMVFLALHLADYIIVHELCHLQELNHSPAFWRLVERTIPNHKEIRNILAHRHTLLLLK
ncbi:MAG: M48 family metallopeptidase [Candidatus Kerfeldbacteria bacterium]|nr:M48 family metallopeptidase [Candidatus Kerfeldbacteria bacterium]